VGIEDRDWYREAPKRRRSLVPWLIGALILAAGLFAASPRGHVLLGLQRTRPSDGLQAHQDVKASVLPGAPVATLDQTPVSSNPDPWQRYLAGEQTCPGGGRTDLPLDRQAQIMLCLINWARQQDGLGSLRETTLLASTALQKGNEIVRCDNFAHAACGGSPAADVLAAGYRGAFGENLYIAGGRDGSPRAALDRWLNSPDHRENLFRPEWRVQGIAVIKLDRFGPYSDATLWVSHFGST
jgi:uncharacterized protein YkwD